MTIVKFNMIKINYNGKFFGVEDKISGFQAIKLLSEDSKNIIAVKVNGKIYDLSTIITENSDITFITSESEDGLSILRHSTAHLLAYAVQEIYKDENPKFAIGPFIENGFYYDFDVVNPFSEANFESIEKKMLEIVKNDEKFIREEWSKDEAIKYFKKKKQQYKVELVNDIPSGEVISIYKVGNFVDLCRGIHVPSTRYLKYFKLTKVAGAYWKGNSNNKMLQRIYGTAWADKDSLDKYFKLIEEAERRDHKKICKVMDLAHFEPEFAPGAPFLHPKGLFIYNELINFMRKKQETAGYIEVSTPRVMDRSLWETSGHWEHYGAHNYSGSTEDGKQFCIKPMNCPGGILVYKQGLKSYRDLPIKMAEFGKVNRYEASGALNGFLRVREFTQDDAHIFCTEDQLEEQCIETVRFILDIYSSFGFSNDTVRIKLSTRPDNRIGDDEIWDISEKSLAQTLDKLGLKYTIFPGEGAFYGPKLEFVLKDALGRDWQIGTLQLDMNLPKRFEMSYIGEDGKKHEPIMLHRAILGSIERFMGIYIEHTEGKFPLWLNPMQVAIATIVSEVEDYAEEIYLELTTNGIRVCVDKRNEKIGYKIRELSLQQIPYILTIGKTEKENKKINVRIFGDDKTYDMDLDKFISILKNKIINKHFDYSLFN